MMMEISSAKQRAKVNDVDLEEAEDLGAVVTFLVGSGVAMHGPRGHGSSSARS